MYAIGDHIRERYERTQNADMPEVPKRAELLDLRHDELKPMFYPYVSPYERTVVYNGADVQIAQFADARLAALFVLFYNWWPTISQYITEVEVEKAQRSSRDQDAAG